MGKFYAFVLGMAAGFGLCVLSMSYHLVRSSEGFHLVKKPAATLDDTYVDIRGFSAQDAVNHPELGLAIAQSGNADLQNEFAGNLVQDLAEQARQLLQPAQ